MSSNVKVILAVAALALAWSGVASAGIISVDPWVNLAYDTTISSNDSSAVSSALNKRDYWIVNRWHQSKVVSPGDPLYIAFDLGADNSAMVSYVRIYNISDASSAFNYHLEYLPAGMENIAENWVAIEGTQRTGVSTNPGDIFQFDAVDARALRWVLTGGTANNFRFTRFEFFTANPTAHNLANVEGATLTHSTNPDVLGADAAKAYNGIIGDRFNAATDQQFLTLMLPEAYDLQFLRLYSEDTGQSIGLFSLEYLVVDEFGESTWKVVPGCANLGPNAYTQMRHPETNAWVTNPDYAAVAHLAVPNIWEVDLTVIPEAAMGLRLNVAMPSTNPTNPILRVWEFEVFGTPVPEPATMSLLALGGLALLRRRK